MGVTGLWQILQPCARPIKIETLNRKRLAVDASIWIYQFLKAVRDKEGNALRNSHVVGFFRRICKLLFFGIKPVFVFDGGAPALKRQTIRARKSRREGRREDAVRTAGKLLAVQMQRRAEEEEAQRKAQRERGPEQEETVPDEGLVYVDELQMTQQERQQNRKFRKKDQYHLPDLNMSMHEMGGPDDPRVMSLEELQAYARQFDTGEDINVYDFSKIDYDSPFFMSLPASDRYNILNAARLRSRLRMGHSKEQLDSMFPDRMAFSKFQIERVRERNELTQRLMHLNGFEDATYGGRVAGEKGREYILVKNEGVEGGWALGVISDEGKSEKPIDLDKPAPMFKKDQDDGSEDDDEFEDVPIEGLNRLPKRRTQTDALTERLMKQRRAVYSSRRRPVKRKQKPKKAQDPNSLFVQSSDDEDEENWEDADEQQELFGDDAEGQSEDEELRKAIAMSLQKDDAMQQDKASSEANDSEEADMLEVFQQHAAEQQAPLPKGSGRAIANIVNKRAFKAAPESREITSFGVPTQKPESSDEDEAMDLQAALAESRRSKRKTNPPPRKLSPKPSTKTDTARDLAKQAGFKGPLPFEKLDLGTSLLGKKKMQERTEAAQGGFENPELAAKEQKKESTTLPPWFSSDLNEDLQAQKAIEAEERRKAREYQNQFKFQDRGESTLRRADTADVIDLEAEDTVPKPKEVISLDSPIPSDDEDQGPPSRDGSSQADNDLKMGDVADQVRAEPLMAIPAQNLNASQPLQHRTASPVDREQTTQMQPDLHVESEDENLEWSESEPETDGQRRTQQKQPSPVRKTSSIEAPEPALGSAESVQAEAPPEENLRRSPSAESHDLEFEDVDLSRRSPAKEATELMDVDEPQSAPPSGLVRQETIIEDDDEFDDFSDPEDAEMLRALTLEAEEHARFASSLNNKSQAQNILDYEKELKQLRNQQKKDRRDADEVTQIMIQECQALLRLFGLPYITAPMEAEAQCAELVHLGLVDGIVTDDSDCFLFGGTRVYKNMFNQAKFVECYLTSDMEKEFALTRDRLIDVAHLLGSDYTEGLPGIGPVTAMEILSEFPTLADFKDWWTKVQNNQIPKSEDAKNSFRKKFRKNASKIFLPSTFPDQRVAMAYQQPEVDATTEAFQWGVPDLEALRSFLMATIGWSQERTDEVLVPVIKDMNRRADEGTQANITAFFDGTVGIGAAGKNSRGEAFAPRKRVEGSKRMGSALNRMAERAKGIREESTAEVVPEKTKAPRKRKTAKKSSAAPATEESGDESDFEEPQRKKSKRKSRAKKAVQTQDAVDDDDE